MAFEVLRTPQVRDAVERTRASEAAQLPGCARQTVLHRYS